MSRVLWRLLLSVFALSAFGCAHAQPVSVLPMPQSFRTNELRVQWETDRDSIGTVHALDCGLASTAENSVLAQETISIAADRFAILDVSPGRLIWTASDLSGAAIDSFELPPPSTGISILPTGSAER